tara:strand:+ start:1192 stop:1374 length:183 start_codon:yes stop_codon:yes gene_type:complete
MAKDAAASVDKNIERLMGRMVSIEKDLSTMKADVKIILETLGNARSHCSFLQLTPSRRSE